VFASLNCDLRYFGAGHQRRRDVHLPSSAEEGEAGRCGLRSVGPVGQVWAMKFGHADRLRFGCRPSSAGLTGRG
jgi:hypothetical protein